MASFKLEEDGSGEREDGEGCCVRSACTIDLSGPVERRFPDTPPHALRPSCLDRRAAILGVCHGNCGSFCTKEMGECF